MRSAKTLAAVALLTISPFASGQPAAISPESIIVSRVGTASSTLSGRGNEIYLDEYNSSGFLIQSFPLPTSSSGTNRRLVVAGDNISEGGLSRSADGRYLIISGYDAAIPYPVNVSGTAGSSIRRVIGRVDHEGNVDTTTALTDFASTGVPRSVVSMDGSEFWMVGSKGGVRHAPLGATGSILLNNDAADPSHLGLFGGWLYLSTDGSSPRISSVGTNLPTTAGQSLNGLPGFPNVGSPDGFHLADLSSAVPGFDTLYVADDTIGLMKFSLVNGFWVSNGTIGEDTDDYRGLAVKRTSNGVVLFAIRKALGTQGGGELVKLTDTTGYRGALIGTPVLLATAGANTAFRGVALAPYLLPDLTVGISGPTHVTTNAPFDYTFIVRNLGNAPATNITVSFNVPPTMVVEAGPDADGFTGPGAAEYEPVVEFTGGSLAPGASATLILTCSAQLDGTYLTLPFTPTVDPGGLIGDANSENKSAFPGVRTVASSSAPAATVFTWTDGFSGSWSDPTKWTNELASGTAPNGNGGSNYILNFDASESFTANNNLSSGFSLNQMNFSGSNVIAISGQQFEFTQDGAKFPSMTQSGTVATRIGQIIGSSQDLTVAVNGTGPLTLSGGLFGDGSLIKTGPGRLQLTAPTTYAGSTVIQGGTLALTGEGGPDGFLISDGSFERPRYGAEGWGYRPDFTGWTMTGNSGVASGYTPWVDAVQHGAQVAFLQAEPSSISQTISVITPGNYQLSFSGANRPGYAANGVIVRIDGNEVGSWDHTQFNTSNSFVYKNLALNLAAGVHTIEFAGWDTNNDGDDVATAIDDISLEGPIGRLPPASPVDLTNAGATLDIGATEQTVSALAGVAGSSIINNGNLIVDTADSTSFGGVISGSGGFSKQGAGTLDLGGVNTYTGDTYVGRGTLVLNSPSLADTAWVIIGDSGTLELNFAGTDIVAGFAVGESGFGPGIYNASNTSGKITGPGSIEVVSPSYVPDIAVEFPDGSDLPNGGTQDFGIIGIETTGDDTRIIHVRNEGNAELYIDAFALGISGVNSADYELFTSGFTDDFYYISLSPGETGIIIIRFSPTGPGVRTAQLEIPSDDPDEANYIVNLTGGAPSAPAFTIQPNSFTIIYNSAVLWEVAASGIPAPTYQWYLGNSGDDSNPVPDATSARFLTPQLTANANYWVRASSAAGSVDSTTAVVTVLPPSLAEIEVRRDLGTGLEPVASGGLIDFGGSAVDVMAQPVAINVGNLGSENLTNLQVSIVGPDAADFGVDVTGFPTSIGSGLSEFFTVYMIPTSEGPKNAGLLIYSNDADESPYVIGLVGNGSSPTPLAVTNPANGLTESAATLRGAVTPNGSAPTAAFEFGTTTAYGTTMPVSLSPDDGTAEQNVTAFLNGLTTGQTYHFRLVASNAWGTTYGADQSFIAQDPQDFSYTNNDDQLTITGYTGPGGAVVIPASIGGLPVVAIGSGAFSYKYSITSVVIPSGVTSIGADAFKYCENLHTVIIPSTVTTIGSSAFYYCHSLLSVTIPFGVTTIEPYTFAFCWGINYLTIPESVTTIKAYAFMNCSALFSVIIPASVESIGDYAFSLWFSLTQAIFMGNAPTMGTNVFQQPGQGFSAGYFNGNQAGFLAPSWPPNIPVVDLGTPSPEIRVEQPTGPELVSGVNRNFGSALPGSVGTSKTFTIRNSGTALLNSLQVTVGGTHAADFVANLTGFPSELAPGAFAQFTITFTPGAAGARDATLSIASNDANENPFVVNLSGSGDPLPFTYTNSDDQLTITGYTGPGGAVVIPDTIGGLRVVVIGDYAFSGKSNITSIQIPEGVSTIGTGAFGYCTGMTSVTIPNSVTYIASAAFRGCSAVTSLSIPAGVNYIDLFAFDFMYSLTGFTVDPGNLNYSSLDGVLFNKNRTVLEIYPAGKSGAYIVPASVTELRGYAFYFCTALTGITLPEGLQTINYGAFEQCDGLTSLTIPSTVNLIRPGSFSDCNSLLSITVTEPNGSYTSQDGVLFNDDLTELIQYPAGKSGFYTVPATVTSIAGQAFINADGLTGVLLPEGLTNLGSAAFYSCGALASVNIPGGVTSIGPTTFTYCPSLATVVLSEGLVNIGDSAFEGCSSLTSIFIPSTVTSIGNQAFMICTQLSSAVFLGAAPAMGTNVFQYAGSGFQAGYLDANEAGFLAPTWPGYPVVNLGNPSPEIRVEQPAGPELASGVTRDFGGRVVEESADGSLIFTVRNSGTAPLNNLQVTRGGNHPFDFWVDLTGFPTQLAPGAFAQFTVYFSPFQFGARNATLSIASNDANENPFVVNLAGTGLPPLFTYTRSDDEMTITGYNGPGGVVTVPAMINGLPVVAIGERAFFDKDSITSIVLPEGIVSIGIQAFLSCDGLTGFTLPDSVISIGQNAFAYCNNITQIHIPANVSTIETLAFAAMNGLTQFTVDPLNTNFRTIDGVLFNADQTALLQYPGGRTGGYTIPSGVTRIESFAFYQTMGLTDITFTEDLLSIGFGTFERCNNLTNVSIPSNVTGIESSAFGHCANLLAINVDPYNANYESVNGVLFDEDLTTLIQYPAGKPEISYVIPATVETIAHSAFIGASNLMGITMPAGLTTIEARAFYDCSGLESVVIPDGVTSIASVTFAYCSNLASVILPAGLTEIDNNAFLECTSLASIIIPSSVTLIDIRAFYGCTNLVTVTFLGDAPVMGTEVFGLAAPGFFVGYFNDYESGFIAPTWPGYPVTNLGTPAPAIRISAGVQDLANSDDLVFGNVLAGSLPGETKVLTIRNRGYAALTDFAITIDGENPSDFSVNASGLPTSLPPGASGQISVTFTPTATRASLATLTIESNDPERSTINLDLSGTGTSNVPFTYRIEAGEVFITGYIGPDGAVVVPNTIAGRQVVGIDEAAFNGKSGLTSILLPDGIRIIGPSAFGGCSALTTFTIPTSVTYIGSNAFSGCDNITQLEIPASVTTIEIGAFNFMGGFTQFTVDPLNTNYSAIDGVLFDFSQTVLLQYPGGRSGLYSLPTGVTRIERSAFGNAVGLTGITFTDDLTNIGAYAFGNTGLTNVAISANVTVIGAGAFSNCASLTSIDVVPLNGNFESVGGVLLNEDQSTLIQYPTGKVDTSYTVPASVTAISESAFFGARNLIGVVMQPGLLTIGSFAFYDCRDLESVVIPASVTQINIQTFAYCNALESVTLSEGLINLGPYAFLSCGSLVNITIPASVSVIEYNAFLGCGRLETATFLGNAPDMGEGVFDGVDEFFYVGYYDPFEAGFLAPTWPGYDVVNLGNVPTPPIANLANLQVSVGTLTPAFAPAVTAYSVSVPNTVNAITLTPIAVSNSATVRINGSTVASGVPSNPLPLDFGNNVITTVVTAANGTTTKAYTLIVARAQSAAIATKSAEVGANRTIQLKGSVIPNGVATVYFEYGVASVSENLTTPQVFQGALSQDFGATLSGLPFATTFTYRAVATGVFGTLYGTEKTFTSVQAPPIAATGDPTGVSGSAATLVGAVDPRGLLTEVYFEYGLTNLYGKKTQVRMVTTAGGFQDFLSTSNGLIPDAIYHYRIIASNEAGTTYGNDVTFRVAVGSGVGNPIPSTSPTVSTGAVAGLTSDSAILLGNVNPNRGTTVVQFQIGTTTVYGRTTAVQGVGNGTEAVDVSIPVSGLIPGTTYQYRLIAGNSAGSTIGANQEFTTKPAPPSAVTGSTEVINNTSIRINGSVKAEAGPADAFIDFGTDPYNFTGSTRATPNTVSGISPSAVSGELQDLRQGLIYYYRIRAVGPGGLTGVGETKSFQVALLSGLIQQFPDAVPLSERQGLLDVVIDPTLPTSGWRLSGEKPWRTPGVPATGLTSGDRVIEFRPVAGYIQPPNKTIAIASNGILSSITRSYTLSDQTGSGAVNVTLRPEGLTEDTRPFELIAKWAMFGEVDVLGQPIWRDSGTSKSGLLPGNHVIIAKAVTGRSTPLPITIRINNGETTSATITYYVAEDKTGTPPEVVDFDTVSTTANLPFAYTGQFRSDAGAGSGFVVRPGVVATAAHVLFDDGTLSSATNMQWLHRHDQQAHDPVPLIPRGYFLLTGYAAQRAADNSPGSSTPESQNLDAAAAYFLSDPGKGGFSGYLASDSTSNEFLLSTALKTLLGYPVDGTPEANLNRMHHSEPADIAFTQGFGKTYVTPDIRSSGGGSGGPLCVQYQNGNYYPAAIYLGGTAQTVVRAIDSSVADLIGFAEASATLSAENTGGEITSTDLVGTENPAVGELEVSIEPAAARAAGAGWRIQASSQYLTSGAHIGGLAANTYRTRFATVPGFVPPTSQLVSVIAGFRKRITFTYEQIFLPPVIDSPASLTAGRGQPLEYRISASNSPTSFTLLGGIPDGLSFNAASGLISGTPNEAGVFNALIGASNSGGSDSKPLAITSLPALGNQTVTLPFNQPMSYAIVSSESGDGVVFGTGNLPTGLALNSTTGVIFGTPQQPGTFRVPIQVTRRGATAGSELQMEFTDTLPLITAESEVNRTIPYGGEATLFVRATGSPEPAYQWYLGASGDKAQPVTGATSSFFTTAPLNTQTQYWVNVFNNSGSVSSSTFTISVSPSANANLSALVPSAGALSPSFNAGISAYSLFVPNEAAALTFTPFAEVPQSSVSVNGSSVPLESASNPVNLVVGMNSVVVQVTAGNGVAERTYTIAVTRGAEPTVTTGVASDITDSTALLHGIATPRGKAVVFFEYGTDTTYGDSTPGQEISDNTAIAVDAPLFGLTAETVYHFRIGITTAAGTIYGNDATFETTEAPPLVATGDATDVTSTKVKLIGAVDSSGNSTTVYFQWGDTILYGNTTPQQVVPAGTNVTDIQFTAEGLIPGNTYHYRLVAINTSGTSYGDNVTFVAGQANGGSGSPALAPDATTGDVTDITTGSANLLGTADPNGGTTFVRFEYGLTNDYGSSSGSKALGNGTDSATVLIPVNGLQAGKIYHYRLVAANSLGTTYGNDATFTTRFLAPLATTGGASPLSPTSARVSGTVRPRGANADVFFEYGTDGVTFPNRIQATPGTVGGDTEANVQLDLTNLDQRVTYRYRLAAQRSGDPASSTVGEVKTLEADALYGLVQRFSREVPISNRENVLTITLSPAGVGAWRFVGETDWRPSGVAVGGLTSGDRLIEYLPAPGYIQPPREQVGIVNGEAPQSIERTYFQTPDAGNATLKVILGPDAVASTGVAVARRAQWRLNGETAWRNSNTMITGLPAGAYLVEFKSIPGRNTPPGAATELINGQSTTVAMTYPQANAPILNPPVVVPFATSSSSRNFPYSYVGQFRTDAGSQSGFVVKPRVVATTSLAIFNDSSLTRNTGMQWLLQRDNGTYEPKPQVPRGTYVFTGYEAQRLSEGTPGTLSMASQNLNVAALYFAEDAGRGGFSGYLSSSNKANEFLQSAASKTMVGYPLNGVSESSHGRMHTTPLSATSFGWELGRTYSSSGIRGLGGMEGGPLCVQFQQGAYYPAAVYLGGTSKSIVRAIDGDIVDMFNRAEISSNGGDNNTGGGITHSSFTSIGATTAAALKVTIEPAAARNGGAGWRLNPEASYRLSGAQKTGLAGGKYVLELKSVNGFEAPLAENVTVTGGQLREITYTYQEMNVAPTVGNVTNRETNEDTPIGPIAVSLFDADDAENSLTLTCTSSNTTVVPQASISLGGSGANRTLTITPAAHQSGAAVITLTVSDGKLTDTDTFTVTVNPLNDPPTITSIPNQTLSLGASTAAIPFVIGDIETPAVSLTLSGASTNTTLVPVSRISFGGSGANRTVTISPAPGQVGSSSITVSVSDGSLSASRTFSVTVSGSAVDAWRFANFSTTSNSGDTADNADPDGDGQVNIDEYTAGTNPKSASDVFRVTSVTMSSGAFSAVVPVKAARVYLLQKRLSLVSGPWVTVATTGIVSVDGVQILTDTAASTSSGFYRILVELSSP